MCGIVGYLGKRAAAPIVVEGIKRLEYRGYDSSGTAIITKDNQLKCYKKKGKIVELERSLPNPQQIEGNLAIAHTRWATHGKPSTTNAHPHLSQNKKIAIVHNGIIENYQNLKNKLKKEGYSFYSQTDSEVIANLVDFFMKDNELTEAVRKALKLVEGTFGLAVINKDNPQKMVAARRGSPLIVGIGNKEFFVTSDIAGIIIHTNKVIYLQDNEIVTINPEEFVISTFDRRAVKAKISEVDWEVSSIDKGDFDHFMLKEIYEQTTSIENAFRGRIVEKLSTTRLGGLHISDDKLRNVEKIQLIACGTSWHAALIGKYLIENLARVPVEVEYASEYRYKNPIIPKNTLVFTISQSGETADTLAALREAQAKGARVLGITNVVGSTIARESNGGVYIHAGIEIGVASTKAFTSQVTVLFLLAVKLGRMRHISPGKGTKLIRELQKIPKKVRQIIDNSEKIKEIAASIKDSTNALYLGRGLNYPVALEGALKLKEISYIHAEGYPAAEMKHGPIALIDKNMPVISLALQDPIYEKILSNLQEVEARNGRIMTIANKGDKKVNKFSEHTIYIPKTLPELQPLLSVIPLQLLAYHVAWMRGLDVDQPRNLAKSVTVE